MVEGQKYKYNIKLTINNINEEKLYLKVYCGAEDYLADSAKVKKGRVAFNCQLTPGFYDIVNKQGKVYWSVIANDDHQFSITTDAANVLATVVSNSQENEFLFNFKLQLANEDSARAQTVAHSFAHLHPTSFVSRMLRLNYYTKYQDQPYSDRYFDSVDFSAPLLYTPAIHPFVAQFFSEKINENKAATQIAKIDLFFSHCDVKSEIGQYYLRWLLKLYMSDTNPEWDVVFVYLYEKYMEPNGCIFLSETNARIIQKNVVRKKRVLNGSIVPYLQAYNENGKTESTENPQRKYTLIWFWDPDCDDCLIETPALQSYYAEHADTYDFEVFAVALTEDIERWKNTIEEMQLTWINTCDGAGETNYDFRDFYNILTTPASFLIDQNHKIIMQQITLEKLHSFFENNQ